MKKFFRTKTVQNKSYEKDFKIIFCINERVDNLMTIIYNTKPRNIMHLIESIHRTLFSIDSSKWCLDSFKDQITVLFKKSVVCRRFKILNEVDEIDDENIITFIYSEELSLMFHIKSSSNLNFNERPSTLKQCPFKFDHEFEKFSLKSFCPSNTVSNNRTIPTSTNQLNRNPNIIGFMNVYRKYQEFLIIYLNIKNMKKTLKHILDSFTFEDINKKYMKLLYSFHIELEFFMGNNPNELSKSGYKSNSYFKKETLLLIIKILKDALIIKNYMLNFRKTNFKIETL